MAGLDGEAGDSSQVFPPWIYGIVPASSIPLELSSFLDYQWPDTALVCSTLSNDSLISLCLGGST